MQTFSSFFGGAFFGGDFFSTTPNVGGGYMPRRARTSTEIFLERREYGLDDRLERILEMWGRPKRKK